MYGGIVAKVYLMSIKPKFAYQIFTGVKKFELRRSIGLDIEPGSRVVLYVSGKVKAILGEFTVGRVIEGTAEYVWKTIRQYGDVGIDSDDWPYIKGAKKAIAIEVLNPVMYDRPIKLDEIKRVIPGFMPPLSYRILYEGEPLYELLLKKIVKKKVDRGSVR